MDETVIQFRGAGQNPIDTLNEFCQDESKKQFILKLQAVVNEEFGKNSEIMVRCSPIFDILTWIDTDFNPLNQAYHWQLLNYICQATAYYTFCKDQKNFAPPWHGSIGHSQGIMMATIASVSSTEEELIENCKWGIIYTGYQGFRMNQLLESGPGEYNMILLKDFQQDVKDKLVKGYNLELSLINTFSQHIYTGRVEDVRRFLADYAEITKQSSNQDKVLYSERKQVPKCIDLGINVAGHNSLNKPLIDILYDDMKGRECHGDFRFPVHSSYDGSPLTKDALIKTLVRLQTCDLINWPLVLQESTRNARSILDFGPGKRDGLYNVSNASIDDCRIFAFNDKDDYHQYLYWCTAEHVPYTGIMKYRGKLRTKFTESLGYQSPYLCAGMTPTSGYLEFVSSAINRGHYAELAGGWFPTHDTFVDGVKELDTMCNGKPFGINIIYANPRLWNIQFPACLEMKNNGINIDGITLGAGVPTVDSGNEYVAKMVAAGMRYIGFKPSSRATIIRVLKIAAANPSVAVILQWTGGRAGGHHSYEDFTDPILEMYGRIRLHSNVILIAGSGMGNGIQSLPYLTGTWSSTYGRTLPFDGILFGSALMACKESCLTDKGKDFLVNCKGSDDWEKCNHVENDTDIISVKSELGEQIHVVATEGAKTWQWLDHTAFKDGVPDDPSTMIDRINATYQKPYFGNIEKMSRKDIIERFMDFTHIHEHFQLRLERVISLFASKDPHGWLSQYEVDAFLKICAKYDEKPVPFIPTLKENFEYWFKKDTLWYCECDLFDADRTLILQGPASVQHISEKNKPLGKMLDEWLASILDHVEDVEVNTLYFEPVKTLSREYEVLHPLASCDEDDHCVFNYQGTDLTIYKYQKTDLVPFFKCILKTGNICLSKDDVAKFKACTGIHQKNAWFGQLCAQAVSIGFHFLLSQVTFNPIGVIHMSQYFERTSSNDYVDQEVVVTPSICSKKVQGQRLEVTLRTDFLVNAVSIGHSVSVFSILGNVDIDVPETSAPSSTITETESDIEISTPKTKHLHVPYSGDMYGSVSGDHNPIHYLKPFATLGNIDDILVHGMWTLSASLSIDVVAERGFFTFRNPLKYGNYITVDSKPCGWNNGQEVIHMQVQDHDDALIIDGKITTKWKKGIVFAGQGSISARDGFTMYKEDKEIRGIYQRSDAYLLQEFGVSILNILEYNPTSITLHLSAEQKALFGNSNKTGNELVFSHPEGVLNFTPLNQVLTLLYHYATVKKNHHNVANYDMIAGHSLGEYIVPVLIVDIPIEQILKLVFLRGIFMYKAVIDSKEYRMVSVNPSRIGKSFEDLEACIAATSATEFVEVVNYNVEGRQYVIAGTIPGLTKVISMFEDAKEEIVLGRTKSSVTLKGITVPFHSSKMRHSANQFKALIEDAMKVDVNYIPLVQKYIPNLVGQVFDNTKEFLEIMRPHCPTENIDQIAKDWDALSENERTRKMFIELMTMQFCSSVKWIPTTKLLSQHMDLVIEISSKPILIKMVQSNPDHKKLYHMSESGATNYT